MSIRDLADQVVADFQDRELPQPTARRVGLPSLPGKADAVVGMRRSGKTWLLYQHLRDLLDDGVPRGHMLYVDFEDERLPPMQATDLQEFVAALFRRTPTAQDGECWLLFDEIQVVPGWEAFVRRMAERSRTHVVVSGSSARMLSREIATSLRGRSLTTEVLPFGFDEVLVHHGEAIPDTWPVSERRRNRLESRFASYLEVGGFPEVQHLGEDLRARVLQEYVDVVLFRDVVERHRVSNVPALRYLVRQLLANPGGRFSINRFYNDQRSQGIAVGKDTLHEYLGYLEDAYLVFPVTIHSESERARMVNPRTCYVVDQGLARAMSRKAARDTGRLLENIVYLELRRRGYRMDYLVTGDGYEVDFVARSVGGEPLLVQVCADASNEGTRRRELRALEAAMDGRSLRSATMVTLVGQETVELDAGRVDVVPAWRWLLEGVPGPQ